MASKIIVLVVMIGVARVSTSYRPIDMKGMIDEMNDKCKNGDDEFACVKVRAMRFLDTIMSKDNYKISDMEVRANEISSRSARSQGDIIDTIEGYIKGHDVTVDLPIGDTKVTVSSKNLNEDELDLKIKFPDAEVDGRRRKNRLRKIAVPIMVLILLKAMTVIPMAIGILKLKAFNALALGFLSFIVSVGLAIFQLCKKIAAEHHPAHISAHGPWDGRSVPDVPLDVAQRLAYNAYL